MDKPHEITPEELVRRWTESMLASLSEEMRAQRTAEIEAMAALLLDQIREARRLGEKLVL